MLARIMFIEAYLYILTFGRKREIELLHRIIINIIYFIFNFENNLCKQTVRKNCVTIEKKNI